MPKRLIEIIRSSLRIKLIIITAAVGLTFIVISTVFFFSLQVQADFFEEALEDSIREMQTVSKLVISINHVSNLYNDYIALPSETNKSKLRFAAKQTDEIFNKIFDDLNKNFDDLEERKPIRNAHNHWHHNSAAIEDLLDKKAPSQKNLSNNRIRFDHHFEETISFLIKTLAIIKPEMVRQLKNARFISSGSITTIAIVLVASLSLVIFVISLLTKTLITPIKQFDEAAAHLSRRDFSYRLKMERHDEFGDLTATFNSMADQLGKNQAILEAMTTHDDLTGLNNRREFFRLLSEEFKRSTRYHHSFALLMIDIDHFKAINDRYGHKAGDNALQAVALLILMQLRPVNRVARYGGDEIAVILPETSEPAALQRPIGSADRLAHKR